MIEIIYNESGKGGKAVVVKPPKNIRQIGSPKGRHKIYVEDYVYTFLHAAVSGGECLKRATILLGKSELSQDIRYTFISGAISCEHFIFQEDGILFDENCWEYIYKEIKEYFDSQEIVGWFLGLAGFPLELTPAIEAAHRKYFAGRDKVLFLSEPAEGEDVFFACEQGILQKKEGYYIYYEKNPAMQEYMITSRERIREICGGMEERDAFAEAFLEDERVIDVKNQDAPEKNNDVRDVFPKESSPEPEPVTFAEQALQNYRSVVRERKETGSRKKANGFLYTAAASAMVILCVIGITTLNNYEKMKQMERALAVFSKEVNPESDIPNDSADGFTVESVPGQVVPQQEPPSNPENTEEEASGQQPADGEQPPTEPGQTSGSGQTQPSAPTETETSNPPGPAETETSNPPGSPETNAAGQGDVETSAQTYLEQGYYTVLPGDKLELICKKIYQTTAMMDKLKEANGITDSDKIYAGQKLVLP